MNTTHFENYPINDAAQARQRLQGNQKLPPDTTLSNLAPVLLTMAEASGTLRISRWMLYRLINSRQLHTVTIGRRRFVPASSLQAFVDQLRNVEEA